MILGQSGAQFLGDAAAQRDVVAGIAGAERPRHLRRDIVGLCLPARSSPAARPLAGRDHRRSSATGGNIVFNNQKKLNAWRKQLPGCPGAPRSRRVARGGNMRRQPWRRSYWRMAPSQPPPTLHRKTPARSVTNPRHPAPRAANPVMGSELAGGASLSIPARIAHRRPRPPEAFPSPPHPCYAGNRIGPPEGGARLEGYHEVQG